MLLLSWWSPLTVVQLTRPYTEGVLVILFFKFRLCHLCREGTATREGLVMLIPLSVPWTASRTQARVTHQHYCG